MNILMGDPLSEYDNLDKFMMLNEALLVNYRAMIEEVITEDDYDDPSDYGIMIATDVATKCTSVEDALEASGSFMLFVNRLIILFGLLDLESKQQIKRVKVNGEIRWELDEEALGELATKYGSD